MGAPTQPGTHSTHTCAHAFTQHTQSQVPGHRCPCTHPQIGLEQVGTCHIHPHARPCAQNTVGHVQTCPCAHPCTPGHTHAHTPSHPALCTQHTAWLYVHRHTQVCVHTAWTHKTTTRSRLSVKTCPWAGPTVSDRRGEEAEPRWASGFGAQRGWNVGWAALEGPTVQTRPALGQGWAAAQERTPKPAPSGDQGTDRSPHAGASACTART